PAEFMAAVLSSDMDNTDKVTMFLDECRVMGLEVLPPDVDASAYMFEATGPGVIRYGLGAIKGVGHGACEAIVAARKAGPFSDLLDFCKRVDSARLNRRTLEQLVMSGALDRLGKNRASLMLQLPEVLRATEQIAREREAGQVSLFGGADASAPALAMELREIDEFPLVQLLNGERETLGHYLSGHPFDPYREELLGLIGHDLGELETIWERRPDVGRGGWRPEVESVVAGQVVGLRKKGESQFCVQREDGRGRSECACFSEAALGHGPLRTADRIPAVQGGLREDTFNGGFSLKAQRCWDYAQVCAGYAQRLSLRLDLRQPGT